MKSLIPFFLVFLLWNCKTEVQQTPPLTYTQLQGKTMGTTYNITYAGEENHQTAIDSILQVVNSQVNTYDPTSTISQFNQSTEGIDLGIEKEAVEAELYKLRKHFIINYEQAREIYEKTSGGFDPTVMPLVNYWGFGYTPKQPITAVDSNKVDSLRQFIGLDKISYNDTRLSKSLQGVQLDFSALAKGYGVDEVGRLLEAKGINNYMVEIGGEVRARGKNSKNEYWNMGVNTPKEGAATNELFAAIRLDNQSIATSGNYRNFYEVAGVKYSHTINPKTGFPERNTLLSASVIAKDCMLADALATSCMVLGLEKAKQLIDRFEEVEAYFIFGTADGKMDIYLTEKLADKVIKL